MESLPAKPALFLFAAAAVALAGAGHFAERGVEGARLLEEQLGPERSWALEPGAPGAEMAGLVELCLPVEGEAAPPELAPGSSEAVRAARAEGWVYPAFEVPEGGLHGAPARPRPRNLRLRLAGPGGEALDPDRLTAVQNGPDGRFELNGHSAHGAPGEWILGTPALTTGRAASFEVTAALAGEVWSGTFDVLDPGAEVEIEVEGAVELRVTPPR